MVVVMVKYEDFPKEQQIGTETLPGTCIVVGTLYLCFTT